MEHIIGWQRIRISLAAFFTNLRRRPAGLTPFNLFFSGLPGTAKTEGAVKLARLAGFTVALVDSSTLDDIAELAGVVDIHANRTLGENKIILGDLLKADILVLDEFLNTRAHVMSQFRLMLQGKLVISGKTVQMSTRAIIGTANLSKDMLAGSANEVDSPTADRWAMLVEVPALTEMTSAEMDAIIDDEAYGDFAGVFKRTCETMAKHYDAVASEAGKPATLYVRTMVAQFGADSPFACQGRRAKLLKSFVLSAVALCQEEKSLDMDATVWQVVRDCLTYHRLSGLELDMTKLTAAHKVALAVLKEAMHNQAEAFIAAEPDLPTKFGLVVRYKKEITPVTKVDVFGQAAGTQDLAFITACRIVLHSPWGVGEPAGLGELLRTGEKPTKEFFESLDGMSPELAAKWPQLSAEERASHWHRWLNATYASEATNGLMSDVRDHLTNWKVTLSPASSTETEGEQDERPDERTVAAASNS
ncbi:MAG TPA: hypothetical protein V6C81_26785 [Planktothrix sp.]|jgi:hypothetical protein